MNQVTGTNPYLRSARMKSTGNYPPDPHYDILVRLRKERIKCGSMPDLLRNLPVDIAHKVLDLAGRDGNVSHVIADIINEQLSKSPERLQPEPDHCPKCGGGGSDG